MIMRFGTYRLTGNLSFAFLLSYLFTTTVWYTTTPSLQLVPNQTASLSCVSFSHHSLGRSNDTSLLGTEEGADLEVLIRIPATEKMNRFWLSFWLEFLISKIGKRLESAWSPNTPNWILESVFIVVHFLSSCQCFCVIWLADIICFLLHCGPN